jgi:MoaA/NifB/PqqE/SkfB family radical SAM enzyme
MVFQATAPYRRARTEGKHTVLPRTDYATLLRYVMRKKGEYLGIIPITTALTPTASVKKHPCQIYATYGRACHVGATTPPNQFSIRADGYVVPLDGLLHESLAAGNVLDDSLKSIMDGYYGSRRHDDFLKLCRYTYENVVMNSPHEATSIQEALVTESYIGSYTSFVGTADQTSACGALVLQ